jgi:3-dehydroquinate synthase
MLKNIVGAFWQPRRVVVDPQTLRTLPARELRCGLAECVKHAIVGDPGLLPWLETHVDKVLELDPASIEALIARSVAVKVRLVVADETEQGERALLNLGHTFGHAIEPIERCGLRHGEAVAIGLCAAMHVATTRGVFPRRDVDRIEALLRRIGLPTRVVLLGDDGRHRAEGGLDRGALLRAMGHDKKNRDGRVRLVLPLAIGRAALVDDATPAEIHAAWDRVGV